MADRYNFEIEQGATWSRVITWTDENGSPMWTDATGWTASMKIKLQKSASTALVSLATGGSGIVLSASGVITITITAAVTAALTFEKAVYDLKLTSPTSVVYRVLEGDVTLDKEVSA